MIRLQEDLFSREVSKVGICCGYVELCNSSHIVPGFSSGGATGARRCCIKEIEFAVGG
jgi:hypothetical protein